MQQRTAAILVVALVALALVFAVNPPLRFVDPGEYETAVVTVQDANGTQLATVDVRIADTSAKRRVGLSRTDSLADGSGMLFVHDDPGSYSYVMRNMSFSLDIVFVDADGSVTRIHHAPADADGEFRGRGKYVLEVPRGWTNATGVTPGDTVRVPETVADR